jgi:hypothetical protein
MQELLNTIADPRTDPSTLAAAIARLGAKDGDAQFWVRIANSDRYRPDHRRRAVFALIKRHVHAPLPIGTLARILDKPTWLTREDIVVVDKLGGLVPLTFNTKDTVFMLPVFRDVPDGRYAFWAIYLRAEGRLTAAALGDILYGPTPDRQVLRRPVHEIGLVPPGS